MLQRNDNPDKNNYHSYNNENQEYEERSGFLQNSQNKKIIERNSISDEIIDHKETDRIESNNKHKSFELIEPGK